MPPMPLAYAGTPPYPIIIMFCCCGCCCRGGTMAAMCGIGIAIGIGIDIDMLPIDIMPAFGITTGAAMAGATGAGMR